MICRELYHWMIGCLFALLDVGRDEGGQEPDSVDAQLRRSIACANNERDLAYTAELVLADARVQWSSTRADLEAEIERLHERWRLRERLCPGPSPAATHAPPDPRQAILADPQMGGEVWICAHMLTPEMIRAWPAWERRYASDAPTLCLAADLPPARTFAHVRPLRLPGMDDSGDGVISARAMTDAHFARVAGDWHWRSNCSDGRWTPADDDERPDKRLAPEEQWRPAIWAELDKS